MSNFVEQNTREQISHMLEEARQLLEQPDGNLPMAADMISDCFLLVRHLTARTSRTPDYLRLETKEH